MLAADLPALRLLVVSDAAPVRNGVGSYYQDLIPLLAERVARVELFCPLIDPDGAWQAGLVLPMPGDSTQKLCFPDYRQLYRIFQDVRPHLVIVATPGVFGISAAMLATHRGIPFLTGFHTSFEQLTELYWPDSWRGKLVEGYFRVSNGYLIKRTAGVIGNSVGVLEQAKALGARNVHLVGTPIARGFLSAPRPHSGTIQRCFYAGRLAKEKNIEALLAAAQALPELEFSVAGDGPLRPLVEQELGRLPNLRYLGWLTREALCRTLDEHDALLLPSHFETFGTIALEAMARSRPAVVTRGCGIADWALLTPGLKVCDDGAGLTQALRELMQLPAPQIQALADRAQHCAQAFNASVADDWLQLLLPLIDTSKAA
jgi:glycosyltransferase involved in cell wall biosynthesis